MAKSWEQQILDTMVDTAQSQSQPNVVIAVVKSVDPLLVAYHGVDYPHGRLLLAERLTKKAYEVQITWDNPYLHEDKHHGAPKAVLDFKAPLAAGDRVFVIQTPDKQKLYVLDKVVDG